MLTDAQREKARERSRQRYARNKTKILAYQAEWKRNNKDKVRDYGKKYDSKRSRSSIDLKNKKKNERRAANVMLFRARDIENRKKNIIKARESGSKYYYSNKAKIRAKEARWRASNPEQSRARSRYYYRNTDLAVRKARSSEYKKLNHDKIRAHLRNRKARKRGCNGKCSAVQAQSRIEFYGGTCAYCTNAPYEHLDHVVPLARGGTGWPANLRPACAKCNMSKGSKLLSEWSQYTL
jgi:5-methylcytosine-specific restriction endonuclease McrA